MRDGWESQARNWARFARTPGHDSTCEDLNVPTLLNLLLPPGRQTLDLGCGEGRLGRLLQSLGDRVTGVDAAPTMVGDLTASHQVPVPAVLADAAALPFGAETFDLVVVARTDHGRVLAVRELA